ncbi:hypothetical protein ACHAWF_006783 [Thalassiosira exigua]
MMRIITSKASCGRHIPASRGIICAAAFGSLSGSSWAFVSTPPNAPTVAPFSLTCPLGLGHCRDNNAVLHRSSVQYRQSRHFFSKNQKEDSDWKTLKKAGGNLLKKGAQKVKSLLPFGKSEEEQRAEMIKKERKDEITGGINTMLKDMPLPIRMMGRMVSPLLAQAANQMAEQSKQAQDMLEEARVRLVNDPVLSENLGEPLQVGQPFSQSSSTTVINGKSSAMVNASFQVVGPRGSGIATMESNEKGVINSLTVNVNGRNISVGASSGSKFGKSMGKSSSIIEAEIIEKK